MALREFTDPSGRHWRVWDTYPDKPQLVRPGYENGWLSFETDGGEKRRLAPFPADWHGLDDAALTGLIQAAHHRDAAGTAAPAS
jgi:hypothetical protein